MEDIAQRVWSFLVGYAQNSTLNGGAGFNAALNGTSTFE
jgi:hypothetical protein